MRTANQRSKYLFLTGLIIGLLIFAPNLLAGELLKGSGDVVFNQYIITLKPNVSMNLTFDARSELPSVARVADELVAVYGIYDDKILHIYENALEGFAAQMDEESAAAMAEDPRVLFVEPDSMARAADIQQNATWGIDRIDQKDLPLSNTYEYTTKAANVHIYILDSGVRSTHNEFTGRIGNGFDAVGDGGGTEDRHGHGTHVAGTAAGTTYGVAKGATIHPIQVLDSSGNAAWSTIIKGIDWVTRNHQKPAVANMSIQGDVTTGVTTAVQNSIKAGVTYVAAAGNSNKDACTSAPANVPETITAGNSTARDARRFDSNWGSCVDMFAPGDNITSASHQSDTGTAQMGGTSMSSPHICGVAALYLANNTNATPAQVKQAILDASTPNKISDLKGTPNKLLYSLFGGGPVPTITADFDFRADKLYVTFTDRSTANNSTINSWKWSFGDGGRSSLQNPSHTYQSAGTYDVVLTVSDGTNSDNITKSVTVSEGTASIRADFTFTTNQLTANFTDQSTGNQTTVTTWSWSFGDGGRSRLQNPSHTYASAGTYEVTLTAGDGTISDRITKSVTVTGGGTTCEAAWDDFKMYWEGDRCSYNGHNWEAKMLNVFQPPASGSMWWTDLGPCQ